MGSRYVLGGALILLPVAFNGLFVALGRAFDYPDILRRDPSEILARFMVGGRRLQVLWWGFTMTAVAVVPVAGLLAAELERTDPGLSQAGLVLGASAGLVQAVALARWPLLVPLLARLHVEARTPTERATVAIIFRAAHRYVGVALGEHLGYLLTGAWTVVIGLALSSRPVSNPLLGWLGVALGVLVALGSLEFVGRSQDRGWPLLERIVPVAYIGWSLWLAAVGVTFLGSAG